MGFPALVLDASGPLVHLDVFESPDLPKHWLRLDRFEGGGYRREVVGVQTDEGVLPSFIYVAADQRARD